MTTTKAKGKTWTKTHNGRGIAIKCTAMTLAQARIFAERIVGGPVRHYITTETEFIFVDRFIHI
jgi:hypothetical protein